MQVNKNNITQFLTATNISFMIPVYQRNYDWTEDNCKQLWSDIWYISQSSDSRTHFLGTICSKSMNGHEKTIIDGQQRITTITLLMKAMHDYVDNVDFKRDIDANYIHNTGYGVAPNHKVKLHLNRRDDAIYNKLLDTPEFRTTEGLSEQEAESSIYKNYAFFYNCINGLTEYQVASVRSALDRLIIVDLDVEGENPQEIFESLNSTGLDLTHVDLLRNFLLMSLEYETQIRLYDEYWYKIEENVRPKNMVRFFVDYLIYVKKSDAVQLGGRRAHVNENNLYSSFKLYYKQLAGDDEKYCASPDITELLLDHMLSCSKVYKRLVFDGGLDMNKMPDIDRTIYSIVNLNEAAASRPVLMYIMEKHLGGEISEKQALEMLRACLSVTFRAKVSHHYGINGQFSGNVLQRLPEKVGEDIIDVFWKALSSGSGRYALPPDNVFQDALLNRPLYEVLRAKGVKYLFYTLEQNTAAAKGLPRYDDPNTSVEHVMPKTLTDEWADYLGADSIHHDDFLNKLGNLTLTSNNSEMSNKSFAEKQAWYKESSFFYTRELAQSEIWSIAHIRRRSKELAHKCIETWSIPKQYQPVIELETDSKRRPKFKFSMIGLSEGDSVSFVENPSKIAIVADDSHVQYEGEKYSLSKLAALLLGRDSSNGITGTSYFTYGGELLSTLRDEVEANVY